MVYITITGIIVIDTFIICHIPYHSCCLCCQGRFGVMLCLGPANIYFAIRVAQGFGYLAFKTVGAAESLHSMSENVKKLLVPQQFL